FSQNLKADSVRLASSCLARGSVRVERITSLGLCETVPGRLKVDARRIEFVPDQPWREGELYRYVLGSSQTTPSCDGTDAICSDTYPLPLQTALLTGPAPTECGPDIDMFFRAGADVATVFNPLKNLPTSDVNANMKDFKEEAETAPNVDTGEHMENTTRVVTAGLAQVGCTTGDCPEQEFMSLQASLDTEILGQGGDIVRVKLYPTILATSSLTIIVAGQESQTGPQV